MTRRTMTDDQLQAIAYRIFDGLCDADVSPPDCATIITYVMAFIAFAGSKDDDDVAIDAMAKGAKGMQRKLIMREKH